MMMRFNKKLFLAFAMVFVLVMGVILVFQYHREKEFLTEQTDRQLSVYNDLIYNYYHRHMRHGFGIADLMSLLPDTTLRVTVIDTLGNVIYDSSVDTCETMDNHLSRPEISLLQTYRAGKVIRESASLGRHYYYYAERFPDLYVRTAMPYDLSFFRSLKAHHYFLYFMALTIVAAMILLYIISRRFSISVQESENKMRRQLTQNISHELKTPLTGILGYLESIIDNPDMPLDKQRLFIARAHSQARRLHELLGDISTLNNLDDNRKMYTFEHCNVADIIAEVISDLRLPIEQKGFHVIQDYPAEIPLRGNRSLLYSIFRNMLDNALAYAGENITITIRMESSDAVHYRFSFTDNGCGIPEEHLPRIFERFYRVDKGRSRKLGGTGLGLSIVKNAVLLHHGTISARNTSPHGLQFLFSLRRF